MHGGEGVSTPVVWLSYRDDVRPERQWDSGMLQRIFDKTLWRVAGGQAYDQYHGFDELPPDATGAVVVLPGQHHLDHVDQLNRDLAKLRWVVLILIGDEWGLFPWHAVEHPNMRLWIMAPHPEAHRDAPARFFGTGWRYDTPDVLHGEPTRKCDTWFFAGQVTHPRRQQTVDALRSLTDRSDPLGAGRVIETPGFIQGLPRDEYLGELAQAWIAPCPSGPATPDTFRLYEALEAGCLPIADATTPDGWTGYWNFTYGDVPFPVIDDWSTLPDLMAELLPDIVSRSNRASAWWQQHKRELAYALDSDVVAVSGAEQRPQTPADLITVLLATSPTPSNPRTDVIEKTVASLRAQPGLEDVEIIVMADGVRPEQEARGPAYDGYLYNLLRLTERWPNVIPVLAPQWLHQANLTKLGLALVKTPYVLFVEHDTPLVDPWDGTVPWADLCHAMAERPDVNLIRLHHEAGIHESHWTMMPDRHPSDIAGVPLMRCAQWSQRPHLARTDFYRQTLDTYFGSKARTFIEDAMHGVLSEQWYNHGDDGWAKFGVWMYAPDGSMKRSYHTDGRGDDPKFDMQFEYDGDVPEGAPYPTSQRVD